MNNDENMIANDKTSNADDKAALAEELKKQNKEFKLSLKMLKKLQQQVLDNAKIEDKGELKKVLLEQIQQAHNITENLYQNQPMRTVEYIAKQENTYYGAGFNYDSGAMERYYSESHTPSYVRYQKTNGDLVHEDGHKSLHMTKVKKLPMNMEQHYKCETMDEISQNLREALVYRNRLRQAKSEEEKQDIIRSGQAKFRAYQQAIDEGKINPLSDNPEDFKKEMKFIFDSVSQYWMKTQPRGYEEAFTTATFDHYFEHSVDELQKNDENYKLYQKTAFTIGGFDFSQFIDDDYEKLIACNNQKILLADKAIQADVNEEDLLDHTLRIYESGIRPYERNGGSAKKELELPKVQSDMSLSEQYELALYKAWIDEIKKVGGEDLAMAQGDEVTKSVTLKIVDGTRFDYQGHYRISMVKELLESGQNPPSNPQKFQEKLNEICTVNGVNVLNVLQSGEAYAFYVNPPVANVGGQYVTGTQFFDDYKALSKAEQDKVKSDMLSKLNQDIAECEKESIENQKQEIAFSKKQCEKFDKLWQDVSWMEKADKMLKKNKEQYVPRGYYGKPQYGEAQKVEKTDIIDLNEPILLAEYQTKVLKQKIVEQTQGIDNATEVHKKKISQSQVAQQHSEYDR